MIGVFCAFVCVYCFFRFVVFLCFLFYSCVGVIFIYVFTIQLQSCNILNIVKSRCGNGQTNVVVDEWWFDFVEETTCATLEPGPWKRLQKTSF